MYWNIRTFDPFFLFFFEYLSQHSYAYGTKGQPTNY